MTGYPTTPSQTAGPFLAIGMVRAGEEYAVPSDTPDAIWIRGTVTDGSGALVPDALIETWQLSPNALGRCPTGPDGTYGILTVKPGQVPYVDGTTSQAPHIDVAVFARGLLRQLVTRIYFADSADANAADPVLAGLPPDARESLVAERTVDGYRFDIRFRGDGETTFFAV
ncbi:peptidase associated/transthyretin-like domain-containing protein [Flindersiella endophytica]